MKKSTLSMVSLVSGITSSILGVLMFPMALVTKSSNGFAILGFVGFVMFLAGWTGLITSSAKLLTTSSSNPDEENDRVIAFKGFWFSISPIVFWMFLAIVVSIR